MRFEDVLAPITTADFLSNYLGTRYLRVAGSPGRFAHLVPWHRLNTALGGLGSAGARVKMCRNGRAVPPREYLNAADLREGAQVNAARLERTLRGGATLIVDGADELLPEVRSLAEEIESCFPIKVGMNLYASWGVERGFDLHWDDHDTLVVQVHGRKAWRVYPPTIPHPLERVRRDHQRPADDQLAWSGHLTDGDVLYMPRGWWHVASPLGEVSVHLTIGLCHPTGLDFLKWTLRDLTQVVDVRTDVPFWKDDCAVEDWVGSIRKLVDARISVPAVRRFERWMEAKVPVRPTLDLPRAATARAHAPLADSDVVALAAERRLFVSDAPVEDHVAFEAAGVRFQTKSAFRPVLEALSATRPIPVAHLVGRLAAEQRPACRLFLMALEAAGALRRVSPVGPTDRVLHSIGVGEVSEGAAWPSS